MKFEKYSTVVIRIGLVIVVLWFAINQLTDPEAWSALVPGFLGFINPVSLIYVNAIVEVIIGIMLFLGLFTRIVALIFSLHLIPIMLSLGYSPSAVRDFGLLMASLSLFFSGSDFLSFDRLIKKKKTL